MKKSLAVISILACTLGLCACGSNTTVNEPIITQEEASSVAQVAETIIQIVSTESQDQYKGDEIAYNGLLSWENAASEVGEYQGIISAEIIEADEKSAVIDVTIGGSIHDAVMEFVLDGESGYFTSISTNVKYSFGEMMGKAGLNTLIGMGTVFVVLVLIAFIISLFQLIPKIQASFEKKKKDDKDIKAEAVDNTIAQIIEKEELSDDLELVAVIAAAIAASEGAASTDGYVVRSIRKRA